MNIGHKQVFARIIARLEADRTTHNVRIALHQVAAVGVHAVRIVEMLQQIIVNIARCLFHPQQDIIDTLYSAFQRLLSIEHGFLSQRPVREIGQYA